MGTRLAQFMLIAAAIAAPGCAAAMSAKAPAPGECRLVGGENLPSGVDPDSICASITHAMTERAPAAHYSVEVRVLSKSRLSAALVVNGHALPGQNLAVSDGVIGPAQIRRFAETLAAVAAQK